CSCAFQLHTSFPTLRTRLRCYEGSDAAGRLSGGSEGRGRKADRRVGSAFDGGSPTPASPAPLPSSTWSRERLPAVPLEVSIAQSSACRITPDPSSFTWLVSAVGVACSTTPVPSSFTWLVFAVGVAVTDAEVAPLSVVAGAASE
ncbi:hypothetical protein MTO96_046693, partial [Rhipicephalus appendiculatus]